MKATQDGTRSQTFHSEINGWSEHIVQLDFETCDQAS